MGDSRWWLLALVLLIAGANLLWLYSITDGDIADVGDGHREECASEELRQRVKELDQAFADLAHGYAHLDADMKEAEDAKCLIRDGSSGHFAVRSDDHSAESHAQHESPAFKHYQLFVLHSFDPLDLQAACASMELVDSVRMDYSMHTLAEGLQKANAATDVLTPLGTASAIRRTVGDAVLKAAILALDDEHAPASIVGLPLLASLPLRPLLSVESDVLVLERGVEEAVLRLLWQLVVTMEQGEAATLAASLGWQVAAGVERKRAQVEAGIEMTPGTFLSGEEDRPLACGLVRAWREFVTARETYDTLYKPTVRLDLSSTTPGRVMASGLSTVSKQRTKTETAELTDLAFSGTNRRLPSQGAAAWWAPYVTEVLESCVAM